MNIKTLSICITALVVGAATLVAQQTKAPDAQHEPQLNENLKCFAPYLGTWVIESEWSNGGKLWAKNKYTIGLGGNFVMARTWAKDGDGEPYERYLTIFAWDKAQNKVVSHGFTYDGSVQQVDMEVETSDGKELIRSQWQPSPANDMVIKQEVSIIDENQYGWKVWSRADESAEFQPLMDGVWKRQTE
jgi:hypothetical protein